MISELTGGSLSHLTVKGDRVIKSYSGNDPRGFEKIEREIAFLQSLPRHLKRYFPEILEIKKTTAEISYTMPYYKNMNSISKHLLNGTLTEVSAFNILKDVLGFMESEIYSLNKSKSSLLYVHETQFRRVRKSLGILRKIHEFSDVVQAETVTLNNQTLANPSKLLDIIERRDGCISLLKPENLSLFHGNFHLDNILTDSKNFILIDPRGELQGSQDYDDAKLLTALHGRYDEVHYGLFGLDQNKLNYTLRFTNPEIGRKYDSLLKEWLGYKLAKMDSIGEEWLKKMLLMESFHMLSLSSYHARKSGYSKERVISFYLTGLKMLNDFMDNKMLENYPLFRPVAQ